MSNVYIPNGMRKTTNKQVSTLLPQILSKIGALQQDRPDLVIAAWDEVIGSRLKTMTRAVSFEQGILTVKVKNSTLYSILSQHERGRLLKLLQKRFPKIEIKNIYFKIGL